ncbi:MAG: hypothetical protein AB1499_16420, partial [Nitrospirota bacterium]
MGNSKANGINTNELMGKCACFVIPAKAGIQRIRDWIPGQARNDKFKSRHHASKLLNSCLRAGLFILLLTSHFILLTSLTGCGRRGDPVLILAPSYDEKKVEQKTGADDKRKKEDADTAAGQEPAAVVPDAPTEVAAVFTGKSIVLVWKEVLKQGVTSYRVYRSSGAGYI